MIKASDEELEKSIESCERWEWFGGGLVVFGVAAAVAIAAIHPRYDSFLEQWGSAIADSLVAIGVAIEIKFGQMAGLCQGELKRRSDGEVAEAKARAAEADQKAQEAELKLEQFRLLTNDALLSGVHTGRQNALASEASRSVTEILAVALGFVKREATSEATRALYIDSKVAPFAGKKFDAVETSTNLQLGALARSLRAALKNAGWIEIERSDPAAGVGLLSMDRAGGPALVRIDVDASNDPELLAAAETLASALNAEGIAATVSPKTEADTTNVVHILVGPKP